jgi:hypothetical protein
MAHGPLSGWMHRVLLPRSQLGYSFSKKRSTMPELYLREMIEMFPDGTSTEGYTDVLSWSV